MELAASFVRSAVLRATESLPDDPLKPPRIGMVVDMSEANTIGGFIPSLVEKQRYPYSRPEFLFFTDEEIALSADQSLRPVVCPKFSHKMPLYAGYAEAINAGKTVQNEDQASARLLTLTQIGCEAEEAKTLECSSLKQVSRKRASLEDDTLLSPSSSSPKSVCASTRAEAALFAVLDGHAGTGAALVASKCLHEHIKSRLGEVLETITLLDRQEWLTLGRRQSDSSYCLSRANLDRAPSEITADQLVIGALEAAFIEMDDQIAEDKHIWRLAGGCAAIVAIVLLGKIYVANAGDCRAVLATSEGVKAVSKDFTPATERKRLQTLAYHNPDLIGNSFSRLEYSRHLTRRDLKTKVLYRDWFMDGWASKTVKESDLRPPLISDCFRKKRLLNTIGVTRGFGDQNLLTVDERLNLKPFLSPVPEISVIDLRQMDSVGDQDVLIIASDGLWDVLSNDDAAMIVRAALRTTEASDPARYSMAAQELLAAARGHNHNGRWTMASGSHASTDDITVFVIPLKNCIAPPAQDEADDDDMISIDED